MHSGCNIKPISSRGMISQLKDLRVTPYELVMLYYNGFSHPKFKDLIERYAILNNIRHTWLASFDDQKLIKKKVQKGYLPSQDEDRDMSREYKKGAFVYTV